jgi:hypothetical protein
MKSAGARPLPEAACRQRGAAKPVADTKTRVTISGLTPGTAYVIQARAVTKAGYTDYGQPVIKIVV